eukprot:3257413-Pleurochrysis_carterae.AAC.3
MLGDGSCLSNANSSPASVVGSSVADADAQALDIPFASPVFSPSILVAAGVLAASAATKPVCALAGNVAVTATGYRQGASV